MCYNRFQGLSVWEKNKYRKLQGTYPVISLTFANVRERNYESTVQRINRILTELYYEHSFLLEGDCLLPEEKEDFRSISQEMPEVTATMAILQPGKRFWAEGYSQDGFGNTGLLFRVSVS